MMMWTEYDPTTGRIQQTTHGVQITQPAPSASLAVLDGVLGDGHTQYVKDGALAPRPACSVQLAQAGTVATLSGLKVGTTVIIGGAGANLITQDDPDGGMQLTFKLPGTYTVAAEQFPELPFRASITVSA